MSERARALEQALRELTAMVRGECPSLLNEDSGGNGDLSYQIEKLLAVDPPPSGASPQATGGYIHHSLTDWIPTPGCDCDRCTSARKSAPKPTGGASPQAETSEDMGDGWYVTVGRWGESLVTIEQRCLSGNADLTDDDAALIRGAAKHLQAFIGQPAPVSPVEPESSSFEANTASNLLQKVELSTLDRYRNTNQMDVDTWMVRAVASSEPRSEDDLVLLDHVIALLKPTVEPEPPTLEPCAHELDYHNCAECVGPKVEPEPCVWREDEDGIWETSCGASWVFTDGSPSENNTKFCHNCGHPVQPVAYVERFEDDEDEAGAPLKVEREQSDEQPSEISAVPHKPVVNLMEALKKSLESLDRARKP